MLPLVSVNEITKLLEQAAAASVDQDIDLDVFMRAAWSAYLESRPGMREHIEDLQLRQQLDEIRKHGRMGQA